ncbi:MAG: hypothetical protein LBL49_05700 [Clostridiales Family XIII bacterium]|jgi:hypothetical protein|nr:hypothetical protein [Clostridiales Family XIII bacterium]
MIDEQIKGALSGTENGRIKEKLSTMPMEGLIELVLVALDKMDEAERISFIASHIDARIGAPHIDADKHDTFLETVSAFCIRCLNGDYYADEDDIEAYFLEIDDNDNDNDNDDNDDSDSDDDDGDDGDDDWDDWDDDGWGEDEWDEDEWDEEDLDYDEFFKNTEWAETFMKLFNQVMVYIKSGDIKTGYEASERLLSCLHELEFNEEFLGTDEPRTYIFIDWNEYFALHYSALFRYHTEPRRAVESAFRCWMDFGEMCEEGFLSNVHELELAEDCILTNIRSEWTWWDIQRLCFKLLEQLYARLGVKFDKASKAVALTDYNVYFYLFAVEGLYEQKDWQNLVEVAPVALSQLSKNVFGAEDWMVAMTEGKMIETIRKYLAEAYEKLEDFEQAFEIAKSMFFEAPDLTRYKYARGLAEKGADVPTFFALVEAKEKEKEGRIFFGWNQENLLCEIYSYEGETQSLLNMALSKRVSQNYDDRIYAALSLIYRALSDAEGVGVKLSKYLESNAEQGGINDMIKYDISPRQQAELLLNAADLLREIIAFHIAAAHRSEYAKAAYYMCVIRDIFRFLNLDEDFQKYYRGVMEENSRRRALRDEMQIVYGND